MIKWKKRGKYGKGLFVSTKESEDYQEKETEEFVEELIFYSNGAHDLITNHVFFTLKAQDKDKWLRQKGNQAYMVEEKKSSDCIEILLNLLIYWINL